jgi:hypothetical protein
MKLLKDNDEPSIVLSSALKLEPTFTTPYKLHEDPSRLSDLKLKLDPISIRSNSDEDAPCRQIEDDIKLTALPIRNRVLKEAEEPAPRKASTNDIDNPIFDKP